MLGRLAGRLRLPIALVVLPILVMAAGVTTAIAQQYDAPVEDYSAYQPAKKCRDSVRPGTRVLSKWIDRRFSGGDAIPSLRSCASGGASEHKEGRAIDWMMDAGKKKHRAEVRRFLDRLFAEDGAGNAHARARRMGVMYVIWNDHMYASYDRFEKRDYLSSSCPSKAKCSKTLRHRDHVHISLSRPGGRGDTSWYAGRL